MTFTDDIATRIVNDFGENSNKAASILRDAITKADYLKTDRVIRCILFLAKGNLMDLNKYIETAIPLLARVSIRASQQPNPKRYT